MMWDQRYPDEVDVYAEGFAWGDLARLEQDGPCVKCGEQTHWIELNFETRICSEECLGALNREWADAEMRASQRVFGEEDAAS